MMQDDRFTVQDRTMFEAIGMQMDDAVAGRYVALSSVYGM
jgi:hypothetical protein